MQYTVQNNLEDYCRKDKEVALSQHNTQAGFLKDRSIHDAVASTQEILHSIHTQKMKALVMQIDLSKAYDRVDWGLLRLILYKIGLDRDLVNWIMGCVCNTSMAIIINGVATVFFKPGRGLRQGCAPSPLLFILIMDSLSNKINLAVSRGIIRGDCISYLKEISHNFFVDDVLLFGMLIKEVWQTFHYIFSKFCMASGMEANYGKSCIYHGEDGKDLSAYVGTLFNFGTNTFISRLQIFGFSYET